MHNHIRTYMQKHPFPLWILPVTLKRCPLSSCWSTGTRNILSAVWLVTEHCCPSTRIRVEKEEEKARDLERCFIPHFPWAFVFVWLAATSSMEDYCPESFSQQSPGCNQPIRPHPHDIKDSALPSQWRNWLWKIPCGRQTDEYGRV